MLCFPEGFERGHFHRLGGVHELSHRVAAEENHQAGNQSHPGRHLERALEKVHVLFADEVIRAHCQDEKGRHGKSVRDGVPEENPTFGIADQRKEIGHFQASVGFVEHVGSGGRSLHEAVGQ